MKFHGDEKKVNNLKFNYMMKNREKQEREERRKYALSKFFFSLAKTTILASIIGIILGSILGDVQPKSETVIIMMVFFVVLAIVFAVIGFRILRK